MSGPCSLFPPLETPGLPACYPLIFKKIRDTKGIIHTKMGTIKDRSGMDLTEAEDIRKRWQEYTEELYKKILMTQVTTMVWPLT